MSDGINLRDYQQDLYQKTVDSFRAGHKRVLVCVGCGAGKSYIFAKMAEVMPWEGVAISWFVSIILCVVLCVAVLPRWTKFTSR